MQISLSPATQQLLEEQMRRYGLATPEEALRVALERMGREEIRYIEDLDPDTQTAIEEGLAQADRGEGRPWEQVRDEIRKRFINP